MDKRKNKTIKINVYDDLDLKLKLMMLELNRDLNRFYRTTRKRKLTW